MTTIGLITALAILARTQSRALWRRCKAADADRDGFTAGSVAAGIAVYCDVAALPDWRQFLRVFPLRGCYHAAMLLLLVAIVNGQKRVLPYPRVLRGIIGASLCVAPIYICCWRAGRYGCALHSAIRLDAGSSVAR